MPNQLLETSASFHHLPGRVRREAMVAAPHEHVEAIAAHPLLLQRDASAQQQLQPAAQRYGQTQDAETHERLALCPRLRALGSLSRKKTPNARQSTQAWLLPNIGTTARGLVTTSIHAGLGSNLQPLVLTHDCSPGHRRPWRG